MNILVVVDRWGESIGGIKPFNEPTRIYIVYFPDIEKPIDLLIFRALKGSVGPRNNKTNGILFVELNGGVGQV